MPKWSLARRREIVHTSCYAKAKFIKLKVKLVTKVYHNIILIIFVQDNNNNNNSFIIVT